MFKSRWRAFCLLCTFSAFYCFAGATLRAGTIIVPNLAFGQEGDAFTAAFAVPIRQQEVYSASQFPTFPVQITQLRFRPDVQWGSGVGAFSALLSKVQFRLSTTSKSPGSLSYQFSDNVGVDEVLVYDAPWVFESGYTGPQLGPKDFDVVLNLQTPFVYDRTAGNLLVEVRNFGRAPQVFVHDDMRSSTLVQRIFIEDPTGSEATAGDQSAAVMQVVYRALDAVPKIVDQPKSAILSVNQTVKLSVSAAGSEPLLYQWLFNGVPLIGEQGSALLIEGITTNLAGAYSVIVSNLLGSVLSSNAVVEVRNGRTGSYVIPSVSEGVEGDAYTAAFAVPIRQQEVYSSSLFPPGEVEIREIRYRPDVQWGSSVGSFRADLSRVQVFLSTTAKVPGSLNLRFSENVGSDQKLVYDAPWIFQTAYEGPPEGPKSFDMVLPLQESFFYDPSMGNLLIELRNYGRAPQVYVHDDSRYGGLMQRIFVENPDADQAAGGDLSAAVIELVFGSPSKAPRIVRQPVNQIAIIGESVGLQVQAVGASPMYFQWTRNGELIPGAITNSLNLIVGSTNVAGHYSVTISNALGLVRSVDASLQVLENQIGTLVIPSIGEKEEGDAFSGALSVPIRQHELYPRSEFPPTPIQIVELRFRPDIDYGSTIGAFAAELSRVQFRLSTTPKAAGELSLTFSENIGADEVLVYDGPWRLETRYLGPPSGPKEFDLVLRLQNPFFYDPAKGNLLVELRNYGRAPAVYVHDGSRFGGLMQRIFVENPDAQKAAGGDLSAAVIQIGYSESPTPPVFALEPRDKTVLLGEDVNFEAKAFGSSPFDYQWFRDGLLIQGATSNVLMLTHVTSLDSGKYFVQVSNLFGSVVSRSAELFVNPPPTLVQIPNVKGSAGSRIRIPIQVSANGMENSLACSLSYNRRLLSFVDFQISSALEGSYFFLNTNDTIIGRVGLTWGLDAGRTLPLGSNLLGELVFLLAPIAANEETRIVFGDQPITREVVNSGAKVLDASFDDGDLSIAFVGFEADVAPRPEGDRRLTLGDWVQVGRFVAGLDDPSSPEEYQRIDCAPAERAGDGRLTVKDWVQSGRYAANLDALAVAGGPLSNLISAPLLGPPSIQDLATTGIVLGELVGEPGQTVSLPVTLTATGGEAAIGFSIRFDPSTLLFSGIEPDTQSGGALFNVNSRQSSTGRIGVALALPGGTQFSAGAKRLAKVNFTVRSVKAGSSSVTFDDVPIVREVVNGGAKEMAASFGPGSVVIGVGAPEVRIALEGATLLVSWPASATGFVLEASPALLSPVWTVVDSQPVLQGQVYQVRLPSLSGVQTYFRLRQ